MLTKENISNPPTGDQLQQLGFSSLQRIAMCLGNAVQEVVYSINVAFADDPTAVEKPIFKSTSRAIGRFSMDSSMKLDQRELTISDSIISGI